MKIALTDILEHNGYTLGSNKNIRRKSFRERLAEIPADVFIEAVKSSKGYLEICKKIGVFRTRKDGGYIFLCQKDTVCIRERCEFLGVSTSHLRVRKPHTRVVTNYIGAGMTPDEIILNFFSGEDTRSISWFTRLNLIRKHNLLPDYCSECGILPKWNGSPLRLQIDHINGNRNDNRIDNLRVLCPNCHSQTHTFAGRNKKSRPFEG